MTVAFTVYGSPEPGGSKRAFVVAGQARVVDANPRAKGWKEQVAQVAGEHSQGLLEGPLGVLFVFYQPRPRSHYGQGRNSGKLKASAHVQPITRPDLLKLARLVEDAMAAVVYRDDSQIVEEHLYKYYGAPARCDVKVWQLDEPAEAKAA